MGASRKNTPGYWGIALRIIALTFFLATMAAPARSETVPSVSAPATAQSTGAWFFPSYINFLPSGIASLFNGYPTGQAACDAYDAWENSLSSHVGADVQLYFSLFPDYPAQGACLAYTTYSQWVASGYLGGELLLGYYQNCPTGYATNDPRIGGPSYSTFTCTNYGAPKQCPPVAAGENPFTLDPGGQTCSRCPPNSSGTFPNACTCDKDYEPNPTKTMCVPADTCPQVKALTPLPADDACAQALDNLHTTQAQKDAACGTLSDAMKAGKSCLADKLTRTPNATNPIPLKVTADIRDNAYQAHFTEIWDKMETIVILMKKNPAMQTACAARRAEIAAEKGCDNAGRCVNCYPESSTQRSHCLKGRPSTSNDAPHTKGNALDVSEASTITPLKQALKARKPPQNIQQFLDDPNPKDCKLKWGGTFTDNYDPIHFQVK